MILLKKCCVGTWQLYTTANCTVFMVGKVYFELKFNFEVLENKAFGFASLFLVMWFEKNCLIFFTATLDFDYTFYVLAS
jgi:hypothetical protein